MVARLIPAIVLLWRWKVQEVARSIRVGVIFALFYLALASEL
jgi:hypothetical protein